VSPSGALTNLQLQSAIPNAASIVSDPDLGQLYIASAARQSVYRVAIADGSVELVAGGFVSLASCCLEFDAASRSLWITDQGANRVHQLCSTAPVDVGHPTQAPIARMTISPNPARGEQRLRFELRAPSRAHVAVFDVAGRLVRALDDRQLLAPGEHEWIWDGRDANGRLVSPGVFFLRVQCDGAQSEAKLVRLR
jgi:flagellar hook capping protein FlgD